MGFVIGYTKHYSETTRTLVKAYGIKFVVQVRGEAGKTNISSIVVTLGSGLGLLVATVLCDFVHVDKRKKLYTGPRSSSSSRKGQLQCE
ncbi:hypothetical protein V5799_033115 [Amblyomma americanum]|uniref:Uncharacterized protein n=1 Tax=Amblyomma americanum TaxID=6943 RepID=A0AAQ4DP87_AMBAM